MKKIYVLLFAFLLLFTGIACSSGNKTSSTNSQDSGNQQTSEQESNGGKDMVADNTQKTEPAKSEAPKAAGKNPIVTITMEDGGIIKAELYPAIAPNTVKNFISLIQKGFYNGVIFHRVIPGFMIQGGDPQGTGSGGPGYSIKGEFSSNGFTNDLKHTRGVLSMARTQIPDSAGSQFFIMHADAPSLDAQYAAFGKVLEGLDEVDKIANTKRDANDKPLQPQKIKDVKVDTFGVKYGEPEKVND